jgi:Uma2 family endonuclease
MIVARPEPAAAIDPSAPDHLLPADADQDQVFIIHNVPWKSYLALRKLLDHHPGLRMTYLEGTLELMSPSRQHELDKTTLARLLEAYADAAELDIFGIGSQTFKKAARQRGLEPDECYCLRKLKRVPDLAIEVDVSRSGIDKLAVYRGLGVAEVWMWRGGRIEVHCLGSKGYEPRERSRILPDLDLADLAAYVQWPSQPRAVRAYRESLRKRRPARR